MDYKKYNDYELVYQVRENDEVAYDVLVKKYSNLVSMLAKKNCRENRYLGIEYEDLYQEGMVGIIKALNDYNPNDTIFYTYASLCAKREMDRLIKSSKRKKHMILNDSISLNKPVTNNDDLLLEDAIALDYDLEKEYEIKEDYNKLLNYKYNLELLDSSIFELRINGFSIDEIAILLEIGYKAVDYRLRKIKKKVLKTVS